MTPRALHLDIAKALAILMVIGVHAHCPAALGRVFGLIDLPLFFFASGYFFRPPADRRELLDFARRKGKGLYLPYLRWSLAFLLLHNLFFLLGLCHPDYLADGKPMHPYSAVETVRHALRIVFTMSGHDDLLGGFWFLRVLLLAALVTAVAHRVLRHRRGADLLLGLGSLCAVALIRTAAAPHTPLHAFSTLPLAVFFFTAGHLYRRHEYPRRYRAAVALPVAGLFAAALWALGDAPRHLVEVSARTLPLYLVGTLSGIYCTLAAARGLARTPLRRPLGFIGRHTLTLLALHLLCFKPVSWLKVQLLDRPLSAIGEYPVIAADNDFFWCVYLAVGAALPALVAWLRQRTPGKSSFGTSV